MNETTLTCVVNMYQEFEPRVGITEQVRGFCMRTSTEDPVSPCDRPGVLPKHFQVPFKNNHLLWSVEQCVEHVYNLVLVYSTLL